MMASTHAHYKVFVWTGENDYFISGTREVGVGAVLINRASHHCDPSSILWAHTWAVIGWSQSSYPEPSNFLQRMLDVNEGLWKGLVLKVRK